MKSIWKKMLKLTIASCAVLAFATIHAQNSPLIHYPFDTVENNTTPDDGEFQYNALFVTENNAEISLKPAPVENGLLFSDNIKCVTPDNALATLDSETTIAFWIMIKSNSFPQKIFSITDENGNKLLTLSASTQSSLTASVGTSFSLTAQTEIINNGFHHVAVSVDPDNTVKIFFDGNESVSETFPEITLQNSSSLTIAADQNLNAVIDDFKIYSNCLNPTDIDNLAQWSQDNPDKDTDGDGITDADETNSHNTNPLLSDSDSDGLSDGDEINSLHSDPLSSDSDGDSISDFDEVNKYHTNPMKNDSDSDSLTDDYEIFTSKTNPTLNDTDGDILSDSDEINIYHTNPLEYDSDGDSLADSDEVDLPLPDSLVALWKFEETSGDKIIDSSGHGNDATLSGYYSRVPGKIGNAFSLDFEACALLENPNFHITDQVTVALWIKGFKEIREESAFSALSDNNVRAFQASLLWGKSNSVYWDAGHAINRWGWNRITKNAYRKALAGTWHHWTFTKNSSSGIMKIFLDGKLFLQDNNCFFPIPTITKFYIGCETENRYFFKGQIDDMRVYNKELNNDKIAILAKMTTYYKNTLPNTPDTDSDTLSDGLEPLAGTTPTIAPDSNIKDKISINNGIQVKYYNIELAHLPDFCCLTPYKTDNLSNGLNFNADINNILTSEKSECVALTANAFFDAPTSGMYSFHLTSDDGSRLLIDGIPVIYNDLTHPAKEVSEQIFLNEGIHSINIHYFEHSLYASLKLEYAGPGIPRREMDGSVLWFPETHSDILDETVAWNRDSDHDKILDVDEAKLGTDRFNPDTDNDGINDFDEINIYHSSPLLTDSDSDGLSDYEEAKLYGTDSNSVDTDGDGVSDFEEINLALSNPLVQDISPDVTLVASTPGKEAEPVAGQWQKLAPAINALGRNGSVKFNLEIPQEGFFRASLNISQAYQSSPVKSFNISLLVDGAFAGTTTAHIADSNSADARFYLPFLPTGNHSFTIKWNNIKSKTLLGINSLNIEKISGPDNNQNGIPDWIDARMAKLSQISIPEASKTSPLFVEGNSQYNIGTLAISGFHTPDNETPVPPEIIPAPNDSWYADIPLNPGQPTNLKFKFQNNFQTVDKTVEWLPTNLMTEPDTTLRLGDSLLLTAFTDQNSPGSATISIDGETINLDYNPDFPSTIPYKFENPGLITIQTAFTANSGETTNAVMNVNVVQAKFSNPPLLELNTPRPWNNPLIPKNTVVSFDKSITAFEELLPDDSRKITISSSSTKKARSAVRLAQNGPIIDSTTINTITIKKPDPRELEIVKSFPDGSVMIEFSIVMSEVPDDLTIHLKIFVPGHTFEDGSIEKTVTAEDFDQYGVFKYRILRTPDAVTGVCHSVEFIQNNSVVDSY